MYSAALSLLKRVAPWGVSTNTLLSLASVTKIRTTPSAIFCGGKIACTVKPLARYKLTTASVAFCKSSKLTGRPTHSFNTACTFASGMVLTPSSTKDLTSKRTSLWPAGRAGDGVGAVGSGRASGDGLGNCCSRPRCNAPASIPPVGGA